MKEELEKLKENPEGFAMSSGSVSERAAQLAKLKFVDIKHSHTVAFPLAKIKRIIKINPEVKNVSKEGSVLIAKAAELFLSYVALKGTQVAALRGGKSIQEKDFMHMLHTTSLTDFLREDFPRRQGEDGSKAKKKVVPKAAAPVLDAEGNEVLTEGLLEVDKSKVDRKDKLAQAAAGTKSLSGFFGKVTKTGASAANAKAASTQESQATMPYLFPVDMEVGSVGQ